MARAQPRLRPVSALPDPSPGPATTRRSFGPWRAVVVLALALVLAIAALLFTRVQLGNRIGALESETGALRATLAERDATVAAQQARLGAVRERARALLELLEEPVQAAP